jgi:hypothetical protein
MTIRQLTHFLVTTSPPQLSAWIVSTQRVHPANPSTIRVYLWTTHARVVMCQTCAKTHTPTFHLSGLSPVERQLPLDKNGHAAHHWHIKRTVCSNSQRHRHVACAQASVDKVCCIGAGQSARNCTAAVACLTAAARQATTHRLKPSEPKLAPHMKPISSNPPLHVSNKKNQAAHLQAGHCETQPQTPPATGTNPCGREVWPTIARLARVAGIMQRTGAI